MLVRSSSSPSTWIAAQMRVVAALRSVNFLTGLRSLKGGTPAKLFQTSTRRLIGHSAAILLSSFWLAKAARLSCAAGAAAWAVMLLSVSIVNVVIVVLLGWERLGAPRSRSSMADRGRQPDVVAFQTLRPQLILLDGAAGVVAPVALRDLARLADADRHPYRAVAAGGVHRDQDRQPQLGVVLDLNRESGRRRRLGLLRGPCHLLVSLHDHSSLRSRKRSREFCRRVPSSIWHVFKGMWQDRELLRGPAAIGWRVTQAFRWVPAGKNHYVYRAHAQGASEKRRAHAFPADRRPQQTDPQRGTTGGSDPGSQTPSGDGMPGLPGGSRSGEDL